MAFVCRGWKARRYPACGAGRAPWRAWRREPELFDPDIGAQIERGLTLGGTDVAAAMEASRAVRLAAAGFFQEHDLAISLTAPCVAWPHRLLGPAEIGGRAVGPRGHAVSRRYGATPAARLSRSPAAAVARPAIGLQIAGPAGSDRRVIDFALWGGEGIRCSRTLEPAMNILLLNPNTTEAITSRLAEAAAAVACLERRSFRRPRRAASPTYQAAPKRRSRGPSCLKCWPSGRGRSMRLSSQPLVIPA